MCFKVPYMYIVVALYSDVCMHINCVLVRYQMNIPTNELFRPLIFFCKKTTLNSQLYLYILLKRWNVFLLVLNRQRMRFSIHSFHIIQQFFSLIPFNKRVFLTLFHSFCVFPFSIISHHHTNKTAYRFLKT